MHILPSALAAQGILTTAQANALQAYILPVNDTSGQPLFPGMPISDLSTAGFEGLDEIAPRHPSPPRPSLGARLPALRHMRRSGAGCVVTR